VQQAGQAARPTRSSVRDSRRQDLETQQAQGRNKAGARSRCGKWAEEGDHEGNAEDCIFVQLTGKWWVGQSLTGFASSEGDRPLIPS